MCKNGAFILLVDDKDIKKQALMHVLCREMTVYVEGAIQVLPSPQDSNFKEPDPNLSVIELEPLLDCEFVGEHIEGDVRGFEGDIGVGGNVSGVESESDDLLDSDYDMESENGDDDTIFQKNVDYEVELGDTNNVNTNETSNESNESGEDDAVESDGDLDEGRVSEEEDEGHKYPVFNPALIYDPDFVLGLIFSTKAEFKKVVQSHAIKIRRTLKFTKNDKSRVYVRCAWGGKINAIQKMNELTFIIRKYNPYHSCPETFHVKNVKTGWLSEKFIQRYKSDPKRNVKGFRFDVMNDINCNVYKDQAYRVKRNALKMIEGSPDYQYTRLWDYADELRKTNPGSTVILGTEDSNEGLRFSKFYVCFKALKDGFQAGCRPIIGVDGCHLKGPHGEILLTAIGIDPNNNLFPLAYAIVSKENGETWGWFLAVLKQDLNIVREHEYTFIFDKQKGLIKAFEEVFPGSDHRFCVRHMHNNFKSEGYRGMAFKNALWMAATATTVNDFRSRMNALKNLSQAAFEWFHDKLAEQWSRSHFNEYPKCDMLLNNVCETFNSNILDARDKSILTMFEWIREYLMKRLQENRDRINGDHLRGETMYIPPLPPNFGRARGRPAKARRREAGVPILKKKKRSRGNKTLKLRRQQKTVKCRCCGEPDHNSSTCPKKHSTKESNQADSQTEAPVKAKKRQRVRKRGDVNLPSGSNTQANGPGMVSDINPTIVEDGQLGNNETILRAMRITISKLPRRVRKTRSQTEATGTSTDEAPSNVASQPEPPPAAATQNPQLLPPLWQAATEKDETLPICLGTLNLPKQNPPKVPGPSMYNQLQISQSNLQAHSQPTGLQPRVQIRAPPPMHGANFTPSFNLTFFFNGESHHYRTPEVCASLRHWFYPIKSNK
ncbi:hypothetical protein BUALT_Bualt01G0136600 [Buddleja alternifolia]|uniref:MULE transposase domain-containing protein n=1 Tax=Buddleja alternifolia TaxID=168488 RepID=A0AAV6Y8E8_9LAMI|nr:hypothetical protein BUALT_Bualt01G0136600 [Buddleja alternifolia]